MSLNPVMWDERLRIKVKKIRDNAFLPKRMTSGSAGLDLYYAPSDDSLKSIFIRPGETRLLETGISIECDRKDIFFVIYSRSSFFKNGVFAHNGVIDNDYRGEIKVVITNVSDTDFRIEYGDRIAQLIPHKIYDVYIEEVEELSKTDRDSGGFGSTGKK